MTPDETPSILPAPHRLVADGTITIRGEGLARLVVRGSATIVLHAGKDVPFTWSGTSDARAPSSEERVWALADGILTVRGAQFMIEVRRGDVDAEISGRMDVAVLGLGHLVSADGTMHDVGSGRRAVHIDGMLVEVVASRGLAA